MSIYIDKLLKGQKPTIEDWRNHLLETHASLAGASPEAFGDCRNAAGLNSYEWLAQCASEIPSPQKVVDLACGDGFLIPLLQKVIPSASIVGIDMSANELTVAKKRDLNRVSFSQTTAEATGLDDHSVEAVFCHMAFMLMTPIEPVVTEIDRILKPGGIFAGVVTAPQDRTVIFAKVQDTVGGFLKSKYSVDFKPISGDPRTQTESGLKEILNQFSDIRIETDDFGANLDPEGAWDHIKNMYIIGALPTLAKAELKNILMSLFEKEKRTGKIPFSFPTRRFIATK